ncbi:hypothetical protein J6590_055279 [Homalodisca vitripennis]|nr:hypothetical protein J6590_055279 [Homalodisca vitripennis]
MTVAVAVAAVLSVSVLLVAGDSKNYSQAQLLRISNVTLQDLHQLMTMEDSGDLEMMATKLETTDVLVLNDSVASIKEELSSMNMTFDVLIEDLQKAIVKEKETLVAPSNKSLCEEGSCLDWNNYYRLADIYNYMDHLQMSYPDKVSVETVGFSAENRPIKLVKIQTDTNTTNAKAVWVDGGVHAREWISPAAATYILHELLTSLQANESTFSGLNYYILPVMNPDGYEYTHTNDRFWRKNRSTNNASDCIGTDLNRNWAYNWGGKESTSDPCSSNYRGAKAFSESETASVSSYMLNSTSQIMGYLSLHSYGQAITFPWAYTYHRPADFRELYNLAYNMTYNISGASYRYGTTAELFYVASGGSQDWAKATANITYSFTMELRDTGQFSFSLPATKILETSKDAFTAFTVLAQKVKS